ncbi:MAG: aldo/keto reductase [Caldilineaceae bacterium]
MSTILPTKRLGKNPLAVTVMGFGTAPIGNLRAVSETAAIESMQFAYENGIRLFDSAPLYGLGESEIRVGKALKGLPRDSFVISTKVGRVLNRDRSAFVYDYSYDGVMRSFEGSLERLGVEAVDIVLVHDPDADTVDHEKDALDHAFPTLVRLREQGVIKAIGSGMNQWQMLERFARNADVDVFLLAGRYTLLEQTSLDFLDYCREEGIGIFLGGVYNSGILAKGPVAGATYNYANAPREIVNKVTAIQEICEQHGVALNVAALHFPPANPAITSLVVGAVKPGEVEANLAARLEEVPEELWHDLRQEGLIERSAPAPS